MNNKLVAMLLFVAAFVGSNHPVQAQKTKKDKSAILTLGKHTVPASEFVYVYKKNNANAPDAFSAKSVREYLDLYTNFKLKVIDAEQQGLDTTEAFRKELDSYKKQLAQPYLTEKSVTDKLVKEAYERMKEEISASHILISVAPDADPRDTLAAYNKIVDLRKKALAGTDFSKLAKENSQDPSAQTNAGNLGYFTALQMVYPFEEAAFKTPVGSISQPVRTRFGYHILKVHDRRPSQGQVRVAHIMVKANSGMPAEDSIAAKQKIEEIYNRLQKGEDWGALTSQFSDDNGSKSKGGVLPPFGTGNMIPAFEDAAFALKKPNDISKPFQTPYGWHIVKLIEKKPLEAFADLEPQLKQKVSKDSRSELNKSVLIARLKKENKLKEDQSALKAALDKADSTLKKGEWTYNASDKVLDKTLFTIKDKKYTVKDFFEHVKKTQHPVNSNASAQYVMKLAYTPFVEKSLMDYEEAHLAEKHDDYRLLVKEYRDGILLFQLMDTKVWSKALEDTTGLRAFFEKNKQNYQWGQRAQAVIYNGANKQVIEQVKKSLKDKTFAVSEPKLDNVRFAKNSAALTDKARATIKQVADALKKDNALRIEVVGYADKGEKDPSNLARKRARLIADSLIAKGIDKARLTPKTAKGEGKAEENQAVSFSTYSTSMKALERSLNANAPLTLQITEGLFQKGENPVLDQLNWKVGDYTIENNDRVVYVEIKAIEQPRPKTLEEARGLAISDYQNYLEKNWIDELKAKYPVKVNEVEVQKLIQQK